MSLRIGLLTAIALISSSVCQAAPNCNYQVYCLKPDGTTFKIRQQLAGTVGDEACKALAQQTFQKELQSRASEILSDETIACTKCRGGKLEVRANRPVVAPFVYDQVVYSGKVVGGEDICRCPTSWLVNETNEDGGIGHADPKACKKLTAINSSVKPDAQSGTEIGTWGFTWGDGFWAWGTTQNGGGAKCTASNCTVEWCRPGSDDC